MSRICFGGTGGLPGPALFQGRVLAPDDARLLLRRRRAIAAGERLAGALVEGAFASIALLGTTAIPLGTLLRLWNAREAGWTARCPDCSGEAVILGYGGSPMSGSGSGWGMCLQCGGRVEVPFNAKAAMRARELADEWRRKTSAFKQEEAASRDACHPMQGGIRAWEEHAAQLVRKAASAPAPRKGIPDRQLTVFDVLDLLRPKRRRAQ